MSAYIIRRCLQMPVVMVLVTVVLFCTIRLLPGDPIFAIIGESDRNLDAAQVEALRERLGLNEPLPVQYLRWIGDVAQGDLGRSVNSRQSVSKQLVERIPNTTQVGITALLVAIAIGIPAGTIAAIKRNTWIDVVVTLIAMFGVAVPNFWFSMLLIWLFVVELNWLPASGFVGIWQDPLNAFQYMILPSIALGTALSGSIMRYTRSSALEVLNQDFIRTARAKGLRERRVVLVHVLRNSLLPVTTVIGLQLGGLLAGSVIVESMFAIPGVGRLAVESIGGRDYPTLQGVVLFFTLVVLVVNLLTDILYAVVDPRIRYS